MINPLKSALCRKAAAAAVVRLRSLNSRALTPVTVALRTHRNRSLCTDTAAVRVLYDGMCPICVTEIRLLEFLQRNRLHKVNFIDISKPGYEGSKFKDITYEMAMEEMTVIDEKDEVHRGIPAFAVMYGAVGLGWLGRFMTWSPVRPFMDRSYAVFARNRLRWTGRTEECTSGRCARNNDR